MLLLLMPPPLLLLWQCGRRVSLLISSVGVHKKEKAPVQPTATQIMLSQLIGGEQKNMDEVQRNKIQQVKKEAF